MIIQFEVIFLVEQKMEGAGNLPHMSWNVSFVYAQQLLPQLNHFFPFISITRKRLVGKECIHEEVGKNYADN